MVRSGGEALTERRSILHLFPTHILRTLCQTAPSAGLHNQGDLGGERRRVQVGLRQPVRRVLRHVLIAQPQRLRPPVQKTLLWNRGNCRLYTLTSRQQPGSRPWQLKNPSELEKQFDSSLQPRHGLRHGCCQTRRRPHNIKRVQCSAATAYFSAGRDGTRCAAALSALMATPFRKGCVSRCSSACVPRFDETLGEAPRHDCRAGRAPATTGRKQTHFGGLVLHPHRICSHETGCMKEESKGYLVHTKEGVP